MRLYWAAPALLVACGSREPPAPQGPLEVAAVAPKQGASMEPLPAPLPSAASVEPPAEPKDAGVFGPAPSASAPVLSPPFRVRAVFVIPSTGSSPKDFFHGDRFRLFEAPSSCAEATGPNPPPHLEVMAEAAAGSHSVFTQVSFSSGVVTNYRGSITIVSVPKKPQKKGKVKLEPMADGNVEGGELSAVWCW